MKKGASARGVTNKEIISFIEPNIRKFHQKRIENLQRVLKGD